MLPNILDQNYHLQIIEQSLLVLAK